MSASHADEIAAHGLAVHPHQHVAEVHGHELDLTPREFEIMLRLVEHPGWVFSAEQLASEGDEGDYSPESVSVLVSRLRRKLARAGASDAIETVRGFGYRLRPAPQGGEATEASAGCDVLRDAGWRLWETVIEAERFGTEQQRRDAAAVLEAARRAIAEALEG
jgi:DNA-binding winged helix-turn-helix (wHTH) protein